MWKDKTFEITKKGVMDGEQWRSPGDYSMLRYAWYIYEFANSFRHARYESVSSLLALAG